jgi:phosphoribosyl-ATP pyrophosphohydrolase/phosphoribosyl-AMP cyclohydrolase
MRSVASVNLAELDRLDFAKGEGLLPAIIQHADTGTVLMLGYMNRVALVATLASRRVVFYSRGKARLWEKGETSGHHLDLADIVADCDHDALLVRAWPRGPVCHSGDATCFGVLPTTARNPEAFLKALESVISERMTTRPEGSYTAKLLESGWPRIAQKVGEEAVELALAGACGTETQVIEEVSDLLYHVLVLLRARGLNLEQVVEKLKERHETREPKAAQSEM